MGQLLHQRGSLSATQGQASCCHTHWKIQRMAYNKRRGRSWKCDLSGMAERESRGNPSPFQCWNSGGPQYLQLCRLFSKRTCSGCFFNSLMSPWAMTSTCGSGLIDQRGARFLSVSPLVVSRLCRGAYKPVAWLVCPRKTTETGEKR